MSVLKKSYTAAYFVCYSLGTLREKVIDLNLD